ncbi:MAG: triose-phosphate isomerase [Flavobacteriaceae bacterium]|nr:triose-phosphate isomerase [Flavobacteriaceae bacterium]
MRKSIVAGNWKMNTTFAEAKALITEIVSDLNNETTEIIVAPPFVNIEAVVKATSNSRIKVAAQNMHAATKGAYTGEVSGSMLKSIGVQHTILGHSERRGYFNETNALLKEKVNSALTQEMTIIFCFGEELEDRKSGNHFKVVQNQIEEALFHLGASSLDHIILAYEPVWAIGTGETASPEQAQEMHAFIRSLVANNYDSVTADKISILYGGSVKPTNAKELFSNPDVDGGLIGGASLKAEDFLTIVNAF